MRKERPTVRRVAATETYAKCAFKQGKTTERVFTVECPSCEKL